MVTVNSAATLKHQSAMEAVMASPSAIEAWSYTLGEHLDLLATCVAFAGQMLEQLHGVSSSDGRYNMTYAATLQFIEVLSLAAKSRMDGFGLFGVERDLRIQLLLRLLPALLPLDATKTEVQPAAFALISAVRQRWIINHVRLPQLSTQQREVLLAALARHVGTQEQNHLERILADGRFDDATLPLPCSPLLLQPLAEQTTLVLRRIESL